MTYFKAIKAALDTSLHAICRHLGVSEADAYVAVATHLTNMSSEWRTGKTPSIDYCSPLCRFAYLYCHTAANANVCELAIRSTPGLSDYIVNKLRDDEQLRVCAFGGGPGTELLAVSKFLFEELDAGPPAAIEFTLIDRVVEWQESWKVLKDQVAAELRRRFGKTTHQPFLVSGNFCPFDMTSLKDYGNVAQLLEHDLYIMNYVVSEVIGGLEKLQKVVNRMARSAPKDARFLLVDRDQTSIISQAKTLLINAGLNVTKPIQSKRNMDSDENSSDLDDYITKIGRRPRVQWKGAFWIAGTKP